MTKVASHSQTTRKAIENLDLAILPHLTFSPEYDFHLFSKLKEDLRGHLSNSNKEMGRSIEFFVKA
jgi:hypothetical protein